MKQPQLTNKVSEFQSVTSLRPTEQPKYQPRYLMNKNIWIESSNITVLSQISKWFSQYLLRSGQMKAK